MSFTGLVAEIPIGAEGLLGATAPPNPSPGKLIDCNNIYYGQGFLGKEGGATKYNSSAITGTPSVLGGTDWWPSSGTQRMVVWTSAGALLKDSGAGTFGVTLASGLSTPSYPPIFIPGGVEAAGNNRKLFIFSSANQVKVLAADGATVANVTSPSADWSGTFPIAGCVHEGRMWAFRGHTAYYSTLTSHEDFAGGGTFHIYPGEGEQIVAGISFKGLLVLFKAPVGIYYIDTSDPTVANWRVIKQSEAIGCVGPGAVIAVDDDVLFMERGGEFNLLSATDRYGNLGASSLSSALELTELGHTLFNKAQLHNCVAVYYTDRKEAHFFVPGSGSTDLNLRYVFDLAAKQPRARLSLRDTGRCLFLRKNSDAVSVPALGDTAGFVWLMDNATRTKGGAYEGMFQTPHLDMSHIEARLATMRKNGAFLELLVQPKGNWNLSVDVYWDGEFSETLQFNMGSAGATLGSFVLGTDSLADIQLLNRRKRVRGSGRRISFRGRNSGDSQDFAVSKFLFSFTVGDEKEAE